MEYLLLIFLFGIIALLLLLFYDKLSYSFWEEFYDYNYKTKLAPVASMIIYDEHVYPIKRDTIQNVSVWVYVWAFDQPNTGYYDYDLKAWYLLTGEVLESFQTLMWFYPPKQVRQ